MKAKRESSDVHRAFALGVRLVIRFCCNAVAANNVVINLVGNGNGNRDIGAMDGQDLSRTSTARKLSGRWPAMS